MLVPNMDLIRISTLSDTVNYPPVCVTKFERDGYRLFYVNAHHVKDVQNPTCETIAKAFDLYQPKAAVVELGGWPAGPGFKPYIEKLLSRTNDPSRAPNEGDFTLLTALRKKIPVFNGEPTYRMIFDDMMALGHSAKDFQAYQLLMWLGQQVRRGEITLDQFEGTSKRNLEYHAISCSIPLNERLSTQDYKDWFAAHYPERRNVLDVHSNDTAPESDPNARLALRMSYDMERTREPHIVQTITDALNQYQSVLVVYGAGHRQSHLKVFEDMLGPSEMIILAPTPPSPLNCRPMNPRKNGSNYEI